MRRFPPLLVVLAALAAGCGDDIPNRPADRDAPGITVGERQYENGGEDGSGADGVEEPNPRGGIAAGPDTPQPGDEQSGDAEQQPPSSDQTP